MFKHNLIELPKLNRIDGPVRYYEVPTGEKYPSVTSVLSAMSDDSYLEEWRNRVGESEADRITKRASARGTEVHELCERFVLNQDPQLNKAMPLAKMMFRQAESVLKESADDIIFSEASLFSHKLKVAGSADLAATWNGKKSIIDFKTSVKNKPKEWITDYFLQCSMYSYMLFEMTGLLYSNLVVIITVEEESVAQVYEEDAKKWLPSVFTLCKNYHKKFPLQG